MPSDGERLAGWKSIAAYLRVSERTAIRWAQEYGLPVARMARGSRPFVQTTTQQLDEWMASKTAADAQQSAETRAALADRPAEGDRQALERVRSWRVPRRVLIWGTALAAGILAVTFATAQLQNGTETSSPPETLAGRVGDGARGEAKTANRVQIDVSLAGGSPSQVTVPEGGMVRVETAGLAMGLQPSERGKELEVWVFRLGRLRGGESARFRLAQRLRWQVPMPLELDGKRFAVTWRGALRPEVTGPSALVDHCCIVCAGMTACGERVEAPCGRCVGPLKRAANE